MQHHPRKRFGQHFLTNASIIHAIIDAIHPCPDDAMVEIGPGLGAMTLPLLQHLNTLTVIEIDRDLSQRLKTMETLAPKLQVIEQDALTVNFETLSSTPLRIVGNLPYNISTPLILSLLTYVRRSCIKDMHFMLQKEVVDRLAATPHHKAYGRLSIMVQYHCRVDPLFNVPADAFYPPPKVDSAVVRLTPYTTSPYPSVDIDTLQKVVATAFHMRRKTLANNMKPLFSALEIKAMDIDPSMRPEQLTIHEYVRMTQHIHQ